MSCLCEMLLGGSSEGNSSALRLIQPHLQEAPLVVAGSTMVLVLEDKYDDSHPVSLNDDSASKNPCPGPVGECQNGCKHALNGSWTSFSHGLPI